jgi:hypothetical protein
MKSPLLIVLTAAVVLLGTGSTLALMNNACKTSHHSWCAPSSDLRHEVKIGHS